MDLQPYYEVVESCIGGLGVDPVECRGDKPGQWTLRKGSATVWVDLWHIEQEERAYYQVMSPIFPVPQDAEMRNNIFAELLSINDRLYGVAFTTYKEWIYIKVIREADGMDDTEAQAMLLRVGNYADQYRQELADKYGIDISQS
jgi:hypothetical protein